MKRDSIYYQIFKRFPALLFSFVDDPPAQAGDYRFASIEVKETAFRIDGVFLPPETKPRTIFFAEVQFQKDESLYHRFFSEILIYLYRNRGQYEDWRGIVIFPTRKLEPTDQTTHRALLNSDQISRVYLDELGNADQQPIEVNLLQLTVASESALIEQARAVLARVEQAGLAPPEKQAIIEVVTTIAVYKFSRLSREEVEAMLGVRLEDTRVYQEAKAEGREEGRREILATSVPLLLEAGLTLEQIAASLKVDIEQVRQAADADAFL